MWDIELILPYFHNVWIIPRPLVRSKTSSFIWARTISAQKIRELAGWNRRLLDTILHNRQWRTWLTETMKDRIQTWSLQPLTICLEICCLTPVKSIWIIFITVLPFESQSTSTNVLIYMYFCCGLWVKKAFCCIP